MSDETEVVEQPILETVIVEPEIETSQEAVSSEPIRSKHEELAISKGWKPKDSFDGDHEEWRPAKEWLDRGELLDTIHGLKQKMKDQSESLEHLVEFNKKVEESTRQRTIAELEAKHRLAVEIGDVEGATAAVKDMVKVTSELPKHEVKQDVAAAVDPAVHAFVSKHGSWFNDNSAEHSAMKAFAIKRDQEIVSQNPGIKPTEALAILEADLKKIFPQKFVSAPVSAVAAPTNTVPKARDATIPEYHRKMIDKLSRTVKNFDKAGYIKMCKELNEF